MKKQLIDVIFASEKRKQALLLLQDGARETEELLKSLHTTRAALLPQMRILEEHHLVSHEKGTYELTAPGKLIADEMLPLVDTIEVLDIDIDYWGTHNLTFIPSHMSQRISKLRECSIINPPFTDVYSLNEEILKTSPISRSHHGFVTFYHPLFPQFFSNMISNKVNVYMIITEGVLEKFKTDRSPLLEEAMKSELFHMFLYPEKPNLVAIVYNDYYTFIRLLKKNGEIDTRYILCDTEESLELAKDLYDYYLKGSIPITDV